MFASLVLPFYITFAIFAALWCAGAWKLRTAMRMTWLSIALMILFLPSCIGVMSIVDLFRYGWFEYSQASAVPRDGYIELPDSATNITLHRDAVGHRARFHTDTTSLRYWFEERRSLQPDLNQNFDHDWFVEEREPLPPSALEMERQVFRDHFSGTAWTFEDTMLRVSVIRSPRGGGYNVWHIPSTGITYLRAGYW